jgi:hypothetical protein
LKTMASTTLPGGTFKLADDLILTRMGYGAMQLAGPHVFGPPKDHDGTIAVLHEVVRFGINHTSTPATSSDRRRAIPPRSLPLGHGAHDQHDEARRHRDRHFRFDG